MDMIDYYSYFGLKKDSSIYEVVDKLSLFLTQVCTKVSRLYSEEEKEKMFSSALYIAQDVYRIFSIGSEREKYNTLMCKQSIIKSKLFRRKRQVIPLEDIYANAKKSWLRVLTCLIPHLETEKQMPFLKEYDYGTILHFLIENTNPAELNEDRTTNYIITLDIVKRSFAVAQERGRSEVKIEDLVTAINSSKVINDANRSRLAVMVFDKWYNQICNTKEEVVYQKN